MDAPINYQLATKENFPAIKHFLKRHKEQSANRDDLIFLARQGESIVGIARLMKTQEDEHVFWLRGVFVIPSKRRLGIASQLLQYLATSIAETQQSSRIIAFPYAHLQAFYQRNGYRLCLTECLSEELPESLSQRYQQAIKNNKNWLCMLRGPNG